jgi:hypothetical protein
MFHCVMRVLKCVHPATNFFNEPHKAGFRVLECSRSSKITYNERTHMRSYPSSLDCLAHRPSTVAG